MDVPTTEQLVERIEKFLVQHDMRPTRFGREATGEPQLLDSLRKGRSPSLDTANKIVAYMARRDDEAGAVDHGTADNLDHHASASGECADISRQAVTA
ncbi:hypothetical protein SAMN05192583_1407 [Sphingomonas gellani]|uniref:Uncharacterized protein n=1 Tax=Sphingomonas gellani TaxID=1166340 RepID=A0A1H8C2J6_9SPHN|nr:hypothetical protein [Sphingomonas gellani]SEM88674.1 hypothetical protein SAMN05192583_1407 [Sphingomonas gellani]